MKALNSLNVEVVELSNNEIKEVEGGIIPFLVFAAGLALGAYSASK